MGDCPGLAALPGRAFYMNRLLFVDVKELLHGQLPGNRFAWYNKIEN